jgi:hypothetical protein
MATKKRKEKEKRKKEKYARSRRKFSFFRRILSALTSINHFLVEIMVPGQWPEPLWKEVAKRQQPKRWFRTRLWPSNFAKKREK